MLCKKILVLACISSVAFARPQNQFQSRELTREELRELRELEERELAKNAQYVFGSSIQDGISDSEHERQEIRDGLKVRGSYRYSDGHHRRTVSYEADEDGFRILSDMIEGLDGPQVNPVGTAEVSSHVAGHHHQYAIKGVPLNS